MTVPPLTFAIRVALGGTIWWSSRLNRSSTEDAPQRDDELVVA
ncbi:MAG: hypothetical protein ABIQ15_03490 [Nocardioides sp.]